MSARWILSMVFFAAACDGEPEDVPPVPANVETPPRDAVDVGGEVDRFIGVVFFADAVDIAPRVEGRLRDVKVAEGDTVEAGDVIAVLDDRASREELAMARARLRSLRSEESRARVEVRAARRRLDQETRLVADGVGTKAARDDAEQALQQALAEGESASARIAEQRATLEQRRRLLGETEIVAPFAGKVASVELSAGAIAGPSAPICRVVGTSSPRVRFAVTAEQALAIEAGQRVSIEVETLEHPIVGRVEEVAAQLDAASGLVFVDASIDAPLVLRPGLAAMVETEA